MNYNSDERALIWLDVFEGISAKKKLALLEYFETPTEMYERFFDYADEMVEIIGKPIYEKMVLGHNEQFINNFVNTLHEKNIQISTIVSSTYPELLKSITTPPILLYCKGDMSLLKTFCIGVVGTRVCTSYGAEMAKKFSKTLAENDVTIVSGLATGIDTYAHQGCLAGNGKTIAVFAGGIDHIYPADNAYLAEEIAQKGLIISEYKPNTPNTHYNFPTRNRIIAGLCRGILIVEASNKSGTMHTKEYAISENRDVFCIPGNINSRASSGTNFLIYSQEAHCVLSPEQILAYYMLETKTNLTKKVEQLDITQQQIVELLSIEPRDFQFLVDELKIPANKLTTQLVKMEISGQIKKQAGNVYILNE